MNNNKYTLQDIGLFLGLISLPPKNVDKFYFDEFENGIFKSYREALADHLASSTKFEDSLLYKPKAFYLLGQFDLAILSLVDDYDFGKKCFQPYSPLIEHHKGDEDYFRNYKYQVYSGTIPHMTEDDHIERLWKEQLKFETKRPEESLPLIGICQLKINNALLIGGGLPFYQIILQKVWEKCNHFVTKDPEKRIKFLIQESFSWNEFTLFIFSDSYKKINELLVHIKEMSVDDLPYDHKIGQTLLHNIVKRVKKKEGFHQKEISSTHLFVNEVTYLGFDFKLCLHNKSDEQENSTQRYNSDDVDRIIEGIRNDDDIRMVERWFVKPGHMYSAAQELKAIYKNNADSGNDEDSSIEHIRVDMGKGDFILPGKSKKTGSRDFIKELLLRFEQADKGEIGKHVHKPYTIPYSQFMIENPKPVALEKHVFIQDWLKKYFNNISKKDKVTKITQDIRVKLKGLGISKILSAQIVSIYANFYDHILDAVSYGYFIELKPFLMGLKNSIDENYKQKDQESFNLTIFQKDLEDMVDVYNKGYNNRLNQCHRMCDITDYNLEYNGGIHQLLSGIDGCYKIVYEYLGVKGGFAFVSSHPGISSQEYALRLNYFHIFQPSIFIATAGHEAANFITLKLKDVPDFKKLDAQIEQLLRQVTAARKKYFVDRIDFKSDPSMKSKLETKFEELQQQKIIHPDKEWNVTDFDFDTILKIRKNLREGEEDYETILDTFLILKLFDKKLIDYYIVDVITYLYTFNGDHKLFWRWHWNYFIQLPQVYKKINQIGEEDIIIFSLRLFIFYKALNGEELEDIRTNTNIPIIPEQVRSEWEKYRRIFSDNLDYVYDKIDKEREQINVKSIFGKIHDFIGRYFVDIYRKLQATQSPDQEWSPLQIEQFVKERSDVFKRDIKDGKPVYIEPDDERFFINFQCLSYAYLRIFYPDDLEDEKITVLPRNGDDGSVKKEKLQELHPYLMDARGGLFVTTAKARRNLFKYRSAMIRSMWDLSLRYKKELFKNFLSDLAGTLNMDTTPNADTEAQTHAEPRTGDTLIEQQEQTYAYDFYLIHTSKDKKEYAEPLFQRMEVEGMSCWYDRENIRAGDGFQDEMEEGFSNSRHFIVIVSNNFKDGQYAALERKAAERINTKDDSRKIVPIIDISLEDFEQNYLFLSEKVAVEWAAGLDEIMEKLKDILGRRG